MTGPANEENAVGYYDFATGDFVHFSENSQDGVYQPIGIMTTPNALYISDFGAGTVYQVTAIPEPQSLGLVVLGLGAFACRLGRRAFR